MSLTLDPRQRAMLAEIGVRVWLPETGDAEAPAYAVEEDTFSDAPVAAAAPVARPVERPPVQAPVASVRGEVAGLDWPTLESAVASCQACGLCQSRKNTVFGVGHTQARWMIVGEAPGENEDLQGEPFVGAAGQLLDNMLKAIELKPESDVYVTNVVKCRPPERHPSAEEVIACRPFLDRELALTGATMAITFGQFAARGLMMGPASRGKVMRYNQLSVVATYHPDDLLRKPEDKAKAWGDLCLAKASHA